jgi:hypothetical protein
MKIVLWGLYVVFSLFCMLIALTSELSPWFTLALALAFIFGPKIWRKF